MLKSTRFQAVIVLAAGGLLEYLAASGNFRLNWPAGAAEQDTKVPGPTVTTDEPLRRILP